MIYNLKNFQNKAVEKIVSSVNELLKIENTNLEFYKNCIFQSPTGSGKTLIMAKAIQEILLETKNTEIVFLWITIGKGELHYQSKIKLEKYLNNIVKVALLEKEYNGTKREIDNRTIVVSNWEKLRQKDQKGNWKNVLMKDGEYENFIDLIENTKNKKKIILVIDESHIGSNTNRANELRKLIAPEITIEVSATPEFAPSNLELSKGFSKIVVVEPKEVIGEGLIKKDIIINPDIKNDEELDSLNAVLECAFKIKYDLNVIYKKNNLNINPLVLIQIPNISVGEAYKENILKFLREKKIDPKKIAIWLSDIKTENLYNIDQNDNEVDFLIFKQAIDTGWDCPRAQILVKLREDSSEKFEIQTLGRILRMPEAKHYNDEKLNFGYVCTDQQKIIVQKENYNPNIIKNLKSFLDKGIENLNLNSVYLPRIDYGDITYEFEEIFDYEFSNYFGLKINDLNYEENLKKIEKKISLNKISLKKKLLSNEKINTENFDLFKEVNIKNIETITASVFAEEIHYIFLNWIRENISPYQSYKRSVPRVKKIIYNCFNKYLGSNNWEDEIFKIQTIILNKANTETFINILNRSVFSFRNKSADLIKTKKDNSEEKIVFNLPFISYFNEYESEKKDYKNYAHNPCYLKIDRSNPEKEFEDYLSKSKKVSWWWKNGEARSDFFSVKYSNSRKITSSFYPDYIIRFIDGSTGLIEVKDIQDRDGDNDTKFKAECLQEYMKTYKSRKLKGGIAIKFSNSWMINNKTTYDWKKTSSNNLEDWMLFEDFC